MRIHVEAPSAASTIQPTLKVVIPNTNAVNLMRETCTLQTKNGEKIDVSTDNVYAVHVVDVVVIIRVDGSCYFISFFFNQL